MGIMVFNIIGFLAGEVIYAIIVWWILGACVMLGLRLYVARRTQKFVLEFIA